MADNKIMCYTVPLYEPVTEFILNIETDTILFTMPEVAIDGFTNNENTFKEFKINEIFPLGFVSLGYLIFWNIPLAQEPMVNYIHIKDIPFQELDNKRRSKFYGEQVIETVMSNNLDGFNHIESFLAAVAPNMDKEKFSCTNFLIKPFNNTTTPIGNVAIPIMDAEVTENINNRPGPNRQLFYPPRSTPRKKNVAFKDAVDILISEDTEISNIFDNSVDVNYLTNNKLGEQKLDM